MFWLNIFIFIPFFSFFPLMFNSELDKRGGDEIKMKHKKKRKLHDDVDWLWLRQSKKVNFTTIFSKQEKKKEKKSITNRNIEVKSIIAIGKTTENWNKIRSFPFSFLHFSTKFLSKKNFINFIFQNPKNKKKILKQIEWKRSIKKWRWLWWCYNI